MTSPTTRPRSPYTFIRFGPSNWWDLRSAKRPKGMNAKETTLMLTDQQAKNIRRYLDSMHHLYEAAALPMRQETERFIGDIMAKHTLAVLRKQAKRLGRRRKKRK